MQRANGRQKQDAYRFKPRARDAPSTSAEEPGPSGSTNGVTPPPPEPPAVKQTEVKPKPGHSAASDNQSQGRNVTAKVPLGPPSQGQSAKGSISRTSSCRPPFATKPGGNEWKDKPRPTSSIAGISRNEGVADAGDGWQVQRSRASLSTHRAPIAHQTPFRDREVLQGRGPHPTKIQPHSTPEFKAPFSDPPPNPPTPTTPNKAKKNKNVSKEEKQRRRDEAGLKELFKPKDSRLTLLNSDLFQRIKSNSSSSPISPGVFQFSSTPLNSGDCVFTSPPPASSKSVADFPTLTSAPSSFNSKPKSFAAAAASLMIPSLQVPFTTPTTSPESPRTPASIPEPVTPVKQQQPKLSKRSITINLSDMIQATPSKSRNAAGNLVSNRQISRHKYDRVGVPDRIRENYKLTVGNLLDSSGPMIIHRGKIRQKKKKASRLKKGILRSREIRKNSSILLQPPPPLDPEDSSALLPTPTLEQVTEQLNTVRLEDSSEIEDSVLTGMSSLTLCPPPEPAESDSIRFKALLQEAEDSTKPPVPLPSAAIELVKLALHSRKFRPYCDMFVTKELHGLVIPLMQELHRLQDRIYKTDPRKLVTKRRFVNGMKEVCSALRLKKAQLVILAPDIEPNSGNGGLDDKTLEILSLAQENGVPYLFSGNRYILGRCIKQTKSPVSAIAILDKQSVEEQFNKVIETVELLRAQYQDEFNRRLQAVMANGG